MKKKGCFIRGTEIYEYKMLKRKPRRINMLIPPGWNYELDGCYFPVNKWLYFARGGEYWKVRKKR